MEYVTWHTAHNVQLDAPLASIGTRATAYILDSVIKIAFVITMYFIMTNLFVQLPNTWLLFFLFTPYLFYSYLFELWNDGQTPGKRICNIKVTSSTGHAAGSQAFFLRWIFRPIDFDILTPVVALVSASLSDNRQRIGDLVAGTIVVSTRVNIRNIYDTYTRLSETYEPLYPEARNMKRSDIVLIKDLMKMEMGRHRDALAQQLFERICTDYGIKTNDPPKRVLFTLAKDYNYYLLRDYRSE